MRWPQFDGELAVDGALLAAAAEDFGHLVHHRPVAVLRAGSVDDVVRIVRHARLAGLRVVPRGAGHTTYGQAQVAGGVVVDLRDLDRIQAVADGRASVGAGTTWRAVVERTMAAGFTPPVLPDYLDLTVGGTLSAGGISGSSFRWGAQIDNVDELVVVTGAGDVVRCSADTEAELFGAVLGGFGRAGIIVSATIRLVAAPAAVEVWRLPYGDPAAMAAALRVFASDGRFDYILGIVTPAESGGWEASIEAAVGAGQATPPVPPGSECEVRSFAEWVRRVDEPVGVLRELGLWDAPHPWLDLFVGESAVDRLLAEVLGTPVLRGVGPLRILLYPLCRSRFTRPGLRLPEEEHCFLLDVLSNGTAAGAAEMVAANQRLFELNRELDGTLYPISAVDGFRPLPSGRGGRGRR